MNDLVTINFNGQELLASQDKNGDIFVGMKPICEGIGLDWKTQLEKVKNDGVLKEVYTLSPIPSKGGCQEMISLPLEYLNGWLFGIQENRVKEEIRPALINYKKECYKTLYDYFHKGVVINEKAHDIVGLLEQALSEIKEKTHLADAQQKVIETQQKEIEQVKPAVESYNKFINSTVNLSIEEFTKICKFPDGSNSYIGKIKMFKLLRSLRILQTNNIPYQEYMKYFVVKTKQIWKGEKTGWDNVSVTLITPYGADWLYNKLKSKFEKIIA